MNNFQTEDERISVFMETLRVALVSDGALTPEITEEMVSEMRAHVLSLYDAYLELGYSPEQAVTLTLAKFGSIEGAIGRRVPSKDSRRAAASMIHACVGIVAFAVAPMTLETSLGDFGFAPMIFGGLAGFFISRRATGSPSTASSFALKVAAAGSLAYLAYGLLLVSSSSMMLDECISRFGIMAGLLLVLGFVSRWSWQESEKYAEAKKDQRKAITR